MKMANMAFERDAEKRRAPQLYIGQHLEPLPHDVNCGINNCKSKVLSRLR